MPPRQAAALFKLAATVRGKDRNREVRTCCGTILAAAVAFLPIAASTAEENLSFYVSNHDQSPAHRVIHPIIGKTNFASFKCTSKFCFVYIKVCTNKNTYIRNRIES